ncbi:MAG: ATP-dependent RecD-like DNA helicase, partial [bacterium]
MTDPAELAGTVARVRFSSADGEFQVVILRIDDGLDVTAIIRGADLRVGEHVRVRGQWRRHTSGERQLDVSHLHRELPATADGIVSFLGSGALPGVGPSLAQRIVDAFGDETLTVLDTVPERIREVPGIGAKKAAAIRDAWRQHGALRDIMIFLQSHGISPAFATRIHKKFGDRAVPIVQHDPYRLAREVRGIGFRKADAIAERAGIRGDDPRRLDAGVAWMLYTAESDGHLYLPRDVLIEHATAMLQVDETRVAEAVARLVERRELVAETVSTDVVGISRRERFLDEEAVARDLCRLASAPPLPAPPAPAVAAAEQALGFQLAPGQRAAVITAASQRVAVLTGGPGTGKTTIVRALLALVGEARVGLAAPTGRAARRLEESTGRTALTLHRLLEFDPRKGGFTRDDKTPLDLDLVVVDEASMIDIDLARALLCALRTGARLVLVGDIDQLPSVGPGDVLRDIIASGVVPVARLDRVFRQAEGSRIVDGAWSVLAGQVPEPDEHATGEYFFIPRDDPDRLAETIVHIVAERLPSAFGLDPLRDIQVLVPMNSGPVGARRLNDDLQAALGGRGPSVERRGRRFHVGDRVMQVRNNYNLDAYNGDIGLVVAVDPNAGVLAVEFDGRRVEVSGDALDDLDLAWAVTVHKSQGSEFRAVVLAISTHHFKLLQRNLIYTAITRARERLVIVGVPRALRM